MKSKTEAIELLKRQITKGQTIFCVPRAGKYMEAYIITSDNPNRLFRITGYIAIAAPTLISYNDSKEALTAGNIGYGLDLYIAQIVSQIVFGTDCDTTYQKL